MARERQNPKTSRVHVKRAKKRLADLGGLFATDWRKAKPKGKPGRYKAARLGRGV